MSRRTKQNATDGWRSSFGPWLRISSVGRDAMPAADAWFALPGLHPSLPGFFRPMILRRDLRFRRLRHSQS